MGEGVLTEAVVGLSPALATLLGLMVAALIGGGWFLIRIAGRMDVHLADCAEERRKASATVARVHERIDAESGARQEDTRKQNEILGEMRADIGYLRGRADIGEKQ